MPLTASVLAVVSGFASLVCVVGVVAVAGAVVALAVEFVAAAGWTVVATAGAALLAVVAVKGDVTLIGAGAGVESITGA